MVLNFSVLTAHKIFNMKIYCYIENGEIVLGPQSLPKNWKNVSNFDLLPEEIVLAYGWLPYFKVSDDREVVVDSTKQIFEDRVVETFTTRDKTQEEIDQENNEILQNKWLEVRERRDEFLKSSDKYALVDVWNTMDSAKQEEWAVYRQKLRDIPQEYADPDLVIFPEVPN